MKSKTTRFGAGGVEEVERLATVAGAGVVRSTFSKGGERAPAPPGLSARAVSGVDEDGRRANFMGSGVLRSTCSIAACSANEADPAPLQSAVQSAMQRRDLGAGVPWAPPDARSRQRWSSYELPGTVAFAARGDWGRCRERRGEWALHVSLKACPSFCGL